MDDQRAMEAAIAAAATVRGATAPNPWVGAVVVGPGGDVIGTGATEPPGRAHAEIGALAAAGPDSRGATLYSTLEPCCHRGRTGPCTDAIVAAGVRRVVVAVEDPDPMVAGRGLAALRAAGVEVTVGVGAEAVADQLWSYFVHRRTGRPGVLLKLAATLDGRTAAPDGTSRWITGAAARADAHALRAESDAVLVGAGTVRADDPALTVRHVSGRDPLRIVLGTAPPTARVRPCLELGGELGEILDELGRRGVVQLLVEGGATVAHAFHAAGLVDRYAVYLAPAFAGGDDGPGLFAGPGAATIDAFRRGRFTALRRLGEDLRIDVVMSR